MKYDISIYYSGTKLKLTTKLYTGCGIFRKKTNVSCSHRKKTCLLQLDFIILRKHTTAG